MPKDYQDLTLSSKILIDLLIIGQFIGEQYTKGSMRLAINPDLRKHYRDKSILQALRRLYEKGWVKTEYKESKKIFKLTKKGQLEALFQKSKLEAFDKLRWDGNWTIISFDVPERARTVRKQLRNLLKQYEFKLLQASVYISPKPFPEAAFHHLKQTQLDRYISVFTAKKISGSRAFKKLFKLS